MDDSEAFNHPYMTFIQGLNMTECYKLAILDGDESIIRYMPDQATYRRLKQDFEQKYPQFAEMLRKEASERRKHCDCVIS
jgi:hypothetical protein